MYVCACLFILFLSPILLLLTDYLSLLRLLFNFDIAFTHFVEKRGFKIQKNSEKENSETKHEIRRKREVNKDKTKL